VKQQINEQVNAKVNYGDVSASIIKHFPDISLSLSDLSVAGIGAFQGDTLAKIHELTISVDVMSFINSKKGMKVNLVELDQARINAIVLRNGKSNWDIMKPGPPEKAGSSQALDLSLKKIVLHDANIAYSDLSSDMLLVAKGLNFEGKGDFANDIVDFSTHTNIKELSYQSGNIIWLKKDLFDLKMDITIDQPKNKYSLGDNLLKLNELGLHFNGTVLMLKNGMDVDLHFKAEKTDFKSILSLIPTIYAKDFDKIKTDGKLSKCEGFVKGHYEGEIYPAFNVDMKIENAMFKYPEAATTVSNINGAVNLSSKGGALDNTVVNIPGMHLVVDGEPIDFSLYLLHPMSDPYVDLKAKGKLDLAKVPKFYPIKGLKRLDGLLVADVQAKTRMSAVQKEQYSQVYAAGNLNITNMHYASDDLDWPVNVQDLSLKFNPQNVEMQKMDATIGSSDFHASGSLTNFLPYLFAHDVIKGELNLSSAKIDLNELQGTTTTSSSTTTPASTEPLKVPANINFHANANIAKLVYQKMDLTNVKGTLSLNNQVLDLSGLNAEIFGGQLGLTGDYNTSGASPEVNFAYHLNSIDMKKAFAAVPAMQKIAPMVQYMEGIVSSDLTMNTKLKNDMSPDYNTMNGNATVKVDLARLVNMPLIQKVAEVTKLPALQNPEVRNAWTILKFTNGRVYMEKPLDFKIADYALNLTGSSGFDKSIAYNMAIDVPSSKLGTASNLANDLLKKSPIPGLNAMPEIITFNLKIGGTIDKPTVSLGPMTSNGKSMKDQAADNLNAEAQKQADLLKQQAQQQADLLKQQAQQQLDKAKQDANKAVQDELNKAKNDLGKKLGLPW